VCSNVPRLRVAVVGGGLIAQLVHLPLLLSQPRRFGVVALCEPSRIVRETLARRLDIPHVHAEHRALLAAGGVDAVVICSPNETHAAIARDCVEAGCAVLVEKPLCLDPADGHEILAAAVRRGVPVQVGYMKRFDELFVRLIDTLPEHARLLHVDSVTVDNGIGERFRPPGLVTGDDLPDDVRAECAEALQTQATGALGAAVASEHARAYSLAFCGALVHDANLVLAALDAAGVATGDVLDAAGTTAATSASCLVELSNGARWSAAWLLAPRARRFSETLRFYFDDGTRKLSLPVPYRDVEHVYAAQLERFHERAAGGDTSCESLAEAVRDVTLMAGAYRRLLEREAVALA
jgi:predicted dehydrogenase